MLPGPVVPKPGGASLPIPFRGGLVRKVIPRYGEAYGYVHDFYNAWEWYTRTHINPHENFLLPAGGGWVCGSAAAPMVIRNPRSLTPLCGLTGQSLFNSAPSDKPYKLLFVYFSNTAKTRYGIAGHWNSPVTTGAHNSVPNPVFRPAPDPFVPLLPNPFGHLAVKPGSETVALSSPKPAAAAKPLRSKPPRPGEHERKGKIASGLGKAVAVAFAATEAADAVEAIYGSLPRHIQRQTLKSGTTRKGAMLGEGVRYSTSLDKARAVFKHYRAIDLSVAMRNLLINHYVDKIIGTMSAKGADKLRKQLGASGWGNII